MRVFLARPQKTAQPPAAIDPEVRRLALAGYERGTEPITSRAADLLPPELAKAWDYRSVSISAERLYWLTADMSYTQLSLYTWPLWNGPEQWGAGPPSVASTWRVWPLRTTVRVIVVPSVKAVQKVPQLRPAGAGVTDRGL